MSSLEAISGYKLETDIVKIIVKDYTHLANSGKTIILCWGGMLYGRTTDKTIMFLYQYTLYNNVITN